MKWATRSSSSNAMLVDLLPLIIISWLILCVCVPLVSGAIRFPLKANHQDSHGAASSKKRRRLRNLESWLTRAALRVS